MSTGKHLTNTELPDFEVALGTLWFTPDAREIWCGDRGRSRGWAIFEGNKPGVIKLDPVDPGASPPGGLPRESPHGYEVSSDGGVLGPSGERVLWLPHNWRSGGVGRGVVGFLTRPTAHYWRPPFWNFTNDLQAVLFYSHRIPTSLSSLPPPHLDP